MHMQKKKYKPLVTCVILIQNEVVVGNAIEFKI